MKKIISTLILMLILNLSYGQHKFGVFTGINYNYLTEGNFKGMLTESSISFHLGVLYEIQLNDKISFRPKLAFSQQGDRTETKQSSDFNLTQLDYKLSYLNVPLEFKFGNKVYFITGPQIGYLIQTEKMSNDLGDVKSDIDYGFNLGGGFKIDNYFVELSTYKGFSKVYEYEDMYNNKLSLTNTLFRLSVGYNF